MLTINLARPIATAYALEVEQGNSTAATGLPNPADPDAQEQLATAIEAACQEATQEIDAQKEELARLCKTVNHLVAKLDQLHQETVVHNRSDIAKLAVEIARKILARKTTEGDYEIQAIVEEALKRAPTRQEITVRVNPEDLPDCQRLQQADLDGPLADLSFVADWSIGRADCLIETPKGIVKSFVEEHLDRIAEALGKVE